MKISNCFQNTRVPSTALHFWFSSQTWMHNWAKYGEISISHSNMPDFIQNYPSMHRRVKMTVCRMQNTASLALRAKCTHTPTQTHKLNLADQYFLSVVWQSSLTPAERFKWLNNTARSKVEKRQKVEKKESLGNILEKCNMVGKIKVSIKKQTHSAYCEPSEKSTYFINMTDLFLQVKGWAIQLLIINKTGVSVQSITKQLIPIHFIDTFRVQLNVNGLTLVNVSFETTRTEWLQCKDHQDQCHT